MRQTIIIKNTSIVSEGKITNADILIQNGIIEKIGKIETGHSNKSVIINGQGKHLFPGIIDGQVHFREPGLTHKGDIYSESKAAVAGGVTSFIDMPNTIPNVLSPAILNDKFRIAAERSFANYSFFMGVTSENMDEVLQSGTSRYIGVSDDGLYFIKKGNLLADNPAIMEKMFSKCKSIIAIHSEREAIIERNEAYYKAEYGDNVPVKFHPLIRSEEACYQATKAAIELAKKYNTRLHILHLSTVAETNLFQNNIPLEEKKITTEVCTHHLWFSEKDYQQLGTLIKWNPAIKTEKDRTGLLKALLDDRIDIITTDHAPHTLEEKQKTYFLAMSGAPMVQHSLNIMLELHFQGLISLEKIAEKMCHNPAILYRINKRGFIREGYHADLALVDLNAVWKVSKENILYKCGWSPLEGQVFHSQVTHTLVNGNIIYENGKFNEIAKGEAFF
ncbi:MAG: dihydroorotase [Ferruginibacter sp.]